MKKFFSLFITAMVMCAAVSMTSCSKDDDKDDPIVDPKPVIEVYNYYIAGISEDMFTYYDIKLEISNFKNTKMVTLTKDLCEKDVLNMPNIIDYSVIEIDGERGVTAVKATVTPKDNIEKMLAETKKEIYLSSLGELLEMRYTPATGECQKENPKKREYSGIEPSAMLEKTDGVRPHYLVVAEEASAKLSVQLKK